MEALTRDFVVRPCSVCADEGWSERSRRRDSAPRSPVEAFCWNVSGTNGQTHDTMNHFAAAKESHLPGEFIFNTPLPSYRPEMRPGRRVRKVRQNFLPWKPAALPSTRNCILSHLLSVSLLSFREQVVAGVNSAKLAMGFREKMSEKALIVATGASRDCTQPLLAMGSDYRVMRGITCVRTAESRTERHLRYFLE